MTVPHGWEQLCGAGASYDPTSSRAPEGAFQAFWDYSQDRGEVEEGKRCLLVAIDCPCTFAYAERHEEANNTIAAQFQRHLRAAVPYKMHPVLINPYHHTLGLST